MASTIHPTAIVSREADLGDGVEIGPFSVLQGRVTLGAGVRLLSHVNLFGPVEIGPGTILYPGACVGFPGQDFKFKLGDETAGVKVGANCILREHITVHAATKNEAPTLLGDRVFMMVGSHVGHDGRVDNDAILVNGSMMAGHCWVGERAILSGGVAIHQFMRVGRLAMITGIVGMSMDVPPFCMVGERNKLRGINRVGMRRAEIGREDINAVETAFRKVFRENRPRPEMIAILDEMGRTSKPVAEMAEFVRTAKRPICSARVAPDEE